MSSDKENLINAKILLDIPEDDLMKQLAIEHGGDRAFPQDLLDQGRRLYENFKSYAEEKVCQSDQIYRIARSETVERRAMLVCAIADLCGGKGAFTCAALIVKEGVEALCKSPWGARK